MPHLLDTSYLIEHWKRLGDIGQKGPEDARAWARRLIDNKGTNAICSPVEVEVLCGVRDSHELELTEAYLKEFEVIDKGQVGPEVWEEARRIAKRVVKYDRKVPSGQRRRARVQNPLSESRQLADCLITAIARHHNYVVETLDQGLIRQAGRTSRKNPGS